MWSIDAPGILDVHAYVYFDGHSLFVQSADAVNPAKGNGKAIGTGWQQVEIPCTIELGRARLVYRTLESNDEDDEEGDKTVARAVPVPARQQQQPQAFRPGGGAFAPAPDEESTRFAPVKGQQLPAPPNPHGLGEPEPTVVAPFDMEETQRGAPLTRKPLPAAGQAPDYPPPSSTVAGPVPAPPQQQYQAYGSVQVATSPHYAPNLSSTLQDPSRMNFPMPPPQQQQMQIMPGQSGAVPMIQGMPPGVQQGMQTERVQGPPPITLLDRMKKDWKDTSLPKKVMLLLMPALFAAVVSVQNQKEEREREAALEEAAALASASASASAALAKKVPPPDTSSPVVVTPSSTVPVISLNTPPQPTGSTKPGGPKTLERQAADALANNDYKGAADLYDQLSAQVLPQDPKHETYAQAARILRAKAAKSP
jgi:hypothetical protein